MAKRKKKKKLRLDRVFIAFIIILALLFGIYKSASFVIDYVLSFFDTNIVGLIQTPKDYIATVVIDPGHGGSDVGANKGEVYEKDINLKTALYLQKALDDKNIKAVLTRTEDVALDSNKITDLNMRAKMSEQNNASYFISIHVNDYADDTSVSGFEVYTRNEESQSLANMISTEISELNLSNNRGVQDGHTLQVLRDNTVPAVLIELGYIKSSDYNYLTNDDQLNNIAKAIAQGIEEEINK